ncbi:hypothetical protein [Burkholderia cepacia]|uniref:hypothetical protein n=1 Tax=Burkholderia cepacia TaxID=292 RepID=UPI001FC8E98F|nr:hypothetical protein [Burkholderia cepacia]
MHDAHGTIDAPAFVAGATARRFGLLRDAQPAHARDTRGTTQRPVAPLAAHATDALVRNLRRARPAPCTVRRFRSDLIDLHPTMTLLPLRGCAARALLASALAVSSFLSHAASPGRVPAPDPL